MTETTIAIDRPPDARSKSASHRGETSRACDCQRVGPRAASRLHPDLYRQVGSGRCAPA